MANRPRFLKPADCDWEQDRSDVEPNSFTSFVYNPHLSLLLEQQRERLPIWKNRDHILYLLEKYQTLVLVGDTGCGKSTQVPQFLLEAGWCHDGKIVGITEPRRIAATSLAARVAEEKGCLLGDVVGYTIRFDNCCESGVTKIKYMTEGILLREMMGDPLLRNYSVIMLDEVHERTLSTDILMGLLKKILRKRRSLKLIIASASVDAVVLRDFFNTNPGCNEEKNTATILSVTGRTYPVSVFYLADPVPDYVEGAIDTVLKIHEREDPGDVLVFLTGQEEVDSVVKRIAERAEPVHDLKVMALPMYGSLTNSEQIKVFRPTPRGFRKVVVATNIAETSVTIPGVVYVVDCGFVKLKWFDSESHTEPLVVVPISKASAQQRAGRAGRIRPGKVYRLYTEASWEGLEDATPGEMERCELSGAVLQLKALGIDNIVRFSFPSPPPPETLASALDLVHALGAIDSEARLTEPLGTRMAELPLSPLHSKALLSAYEFGCSDEMCSILALLQVKSVFSKPGGGAAALKARVAHRNFEVAEGDLLTALNAYTAFSQANDKQRWCHKHFLNHKALVRVQKIRLQVESILRSFEIPLISSKGKSEAVCKSIAAGFFANAAYLHASGVYKSVRGGKDLHIHPSSVLYTLQQPQWVVFCETIQSQRLYMSEVTVVHPDWLHELAPHFYHVVTEK